MRAGKPSAAVPLFFFPHAGQDSREPEFLAKGSGLTAGFYSTGVVLRSRESAVRMEFLGASPHRRLVGEDRLPGRVNFLMGERAGWQSGIPIYATVAYRDLYPGIDMVYGSNGRNLKSEFRLAVGADPSQIRIRYSGAWPRVDEDGSLVTAVDGEEFREQKPVAWQQGAARIEVPTRFVVHDDGTVGLVVGDYDQALPLVIDPVLVYSTLLGGSSSDSALAMAVDSTGAAYLAGFTASYDFPSANPVQNRSGGGNDVFVAKLNAAGTALVYCTYLGGTGDDRAYGIAVDSTGSAYVTGSTASPNFPVVKPLQTKLLGARNVFVAKLNPAGTALVFGTYLGGGASDTGYGIAVDAAGNSYVAGDTTSITFPASGFQKSLRGSQDGFVFKLSTDGSRLVYSSFLGGSASDHAAAIAVDSAGDAYVTGSTFSTDFPVANAFQASNAGGQDAVVSKISADGNSLLFSTYFGGSGGGASYPEAGQAIALDAQSNVYVAGVTSSPNLPMFQPLQASLDGWEDAFVVKLTSAGWPVYSTYFGGSGMDYANAIAVDGSGNAYIAGYTYSMDLPAVNALQPNIAAAGDIDAFVAILNSSGAALLYSSYLGGAGSDTATSVALDANGGIYVAGWTLSTSFPLAHPLQSTNGGNYGAFVWKMQQVSLRVACTHTGNFTQGQNGSYTVTVTNASTLPTSGTVTVSDILPTGLTLVSMAGAGWTCTGTTCIRSDSLNAGLAYPAITVTVKVAAGAASPQQNTVTATGGGDILSRTSTDSTVIVSGATYSISGIVTLAGASLSGVKVALSGSQAASITTDGGGNYAFTNLAGGGSYTVTPSATNYGFSPVSQAVNGLSVNQSWNFSAAPNLAQGKSATQSSTYATAVATLAVDGKTDGVFADASVSIAGYAANAWWQVDLGASAKISTIGIWGRTDCCVSYLSDYWVFVSDTPFNASDTPSTLQTRAGTWSSHQVSAPAPNSSIAATGAQGRYVRIQLTGTGYLELAEFQIFGTWVGTNLAQRKSATQSSTYSTASASLAVDGNTDGVYPHGSVSIAGYAPNAWWQVDLGASAQVSSIAAWGRTDCCTSYLSDYWVFVSDTPFGSSDTPSTLQSRAGTWSSHQTVAPGPSTTISVPGAQGRYIRFQLSGTNYLELAEVQVFGAWVANLAQGKTATQSATYSTCVAGLAVDGKTDGVFADGSIAITGYGANSWWQVDLGASATLTSISLWGRTDCCSSYLGDYWVFVSDTPFSASDTPATLQIRAGTWSSHQTSAPMPSAAIRIPGAQGRYVRIQLSGTNYLELAEAQVFGTWR